LRAGFACPAQGLKQRHPYKNNLELCFEHRAAIKKMSPILLFWLSVSPFGCGYNGKLCWQTPVCQILVRDGDPPKLAFKGPISLACAAGTFLETLIQ
jgi:hypothetical protein